MRRYLLVAAVTAAAATLTGSAPAGSAPAGPAALGTRAAAGTQLWVARFREGGVSGDSAMAVSPAGRRVFVAGESFGGATGVDFKTVAFSTATGSQLWASRYSGPRRNQDNVSAVAVSPGGRRVFVTGSTSSTWNARSYYVTVSYSAATGRRLWVSRFGNGGDGASAVAVSPGGATVFVTGFSDNGGDYATVAYSAATGRQLWVSRYKGPGNGSDAPQSVAVSPGGATVFVTGDSEGRTPDDYATVAYSAATGRQLWARRYNGPGNGLDRAASLTVSPDGGMVFVTGGSDGRTTGTDYTTIAYGAATGKQLWARRYNDLGNGFDAATSVAVSPSGATVFVTGQSKNRTTGYDYATVAYSAATGRQLWASRYHGYEATSVAVSPDGAAVYVTGSGTGGALAGYATVAYRAATGRQLWASRYGGSHAGASSVAVSPGGRRVFVTGLSGDDYATVAYRG